MHLTISFLGVVQVAITGKAQKQGSAEAVPGDKKSVMVALYYVSIISQVCNISQVHKK